MMLSKLLWVGLTTFGQGYPYYYSMFDDKLSVKDGTFLLYFGLIAFFDMTSDIRVLTTFKVGFPGAILFMILKPTANITDILEIR